MTRPNTWIAVAVLATAFVPTARADGPNEIRAVSFDEDAGVTRIRVRGAQTPTFTVYKLEKPSRVVIDVPRARLAESLRGHESGATFSASTWAVSTIAAQQLDDGGQVVRVIVTLARPGRYDVKTDANEVIIFVTARDVAPKQPNAEALSKAQADTEQARRAAATAQADAARARDSATAAQADAERLRKAAAEQAARADAAQRAARLMTERDAANRTGQQASAADLARAKAEATQARQDATKAQEAASAAQSQAERMRIAAERAKQDAVAETSRAKHEADAAKQDMLKSRAEAEAAKQAAARDALLAKQDMMKSRAEAEAAKQAAARDALLAKQEMLKSRAEADAAKQAAARDAMLANQAAEVAKQAATRETAAAKQAAARDAEAARQDLARTRAEAEAAKHEAARIKAEAVAAQAAAAKQLDAAARAKAEADKARREAAAAREDAAKTTELATRTKAEAEAARSDAAKARDEAARTKSEAELAQRQAEAARRDAATKRAEADTARSDAATIKDAVAKTRAEAAAARTDAEQARTEAATAKTDIARARSEAEAAKADAARARADADAAKLAAAGDRKKAELARSDADKLLRDAKHQLSELDKKTAAAQALEDKARAVNAAAQAREESAREEAARAKQERELAEAAATLAAQRAAETTTSRTRVASDRQRLEAEALAKTAEARLAKARRATEEAEARRVAAETAAASAKQELDQTRTTLASVEHQRTAAEAAASAAGRKRGEAEAAASDAARRRADAETAATEAGKKRKEAETAATLASQRRGEAEQQRLTAEAQRKAAEDAARTAKAAASAAEQQRTVAEKATRDANSAKQTAEASIEELTMRRLAAEQAASELEVRSKAEAKAQAEVAAFKVRKASEEELAKARGEATRLADERKRAESQLAARRKAVASQQAETTRLEAMAVQARDAANREDKRRAHLATQRVAEETELARLALLRATRDDAKLASKPVARPAAPPVTTPVVTTITKPVVAKAPTAKVTELAFKGAAGTGQVDLTITGDATVTVGEITATHVELIVDNADLAAKLERKLDVSRYGSPVRAVSSFRDRRMPGRVRVIAELTEPVTPTFDRSANSIHWRFASTAGARPPAALPNASAVSSTGTPPKRTAQAPRTQSVPSPVVGGFGAASTPVAQQSVSQVPPQGTRRRVYRGTTVDFDFKDAPIHDLLRFIADTGRVNIVVPDNITAKVTVRLKRVPWDQALEVILSSHGLWYRREGNLFRIAPRKELDKEDEDAALRAEAARKAEVPQTDVIRLNYASASELKPKLQGMISPSGTLEVDERQNALIINDVSGNRAAIYKLALGLDTQTPQISIEARIVEARSTFLRQIGVQWGGRALATAAGGNATGLIFPSSFALTGGNEDAQTNRGGVATPSDFAVNLPASTGSGEGGAIGLSLGSIGGNFNLNLRLSALEDTGTVRIVSAPKITVLNNKPAAITQGVSIPIQVISAQGTQTQLVQADLSLEVTPYVSPRDCAVQMKIKVTKNEPDFVNVGARGDPSFLRKEASTTMLVNDGDTSVLGGIYTRNSGLAYKKIPFFGDIPVLGWLFKNRRENDDRTEILVFITPKITNKGALTCQ